MKFNQHIYCIFSCQIKPHHYIIILFQVHNLINQFFQLCEEFSWKTNLFTDIHPPSTLRFTLCPLVQVFTPVLCVSYSSVWVYGGYLDIHQDRHCYQQQQQYSHIPHHQRSCISILETSQRFYHIFILKASLIHIYLITSHILL